MTFGLWLFVVIVAIVVFAVIVVKQEAKKVALMSPVLADEKRPQFRRFCG
jgi:hypothetical protein